MRNCTIASCRDVCVDVTAQVARAYDVNTRHDGVLAVLDLQHMPEGCATWPAFWTLSAQGPWPHGGEIDIVEGAYLLFSLI